MEWDTDYDVYVVAENQKGKSQPGVVSFRTSTEPASIIPGTYDALIALSPRLN